MDAGHWDPFGEMDALRSRMDRMLERMLVPAERPAYWAPPVDIVETEQAIVLRADVPGVRLEDLDIELDGDTLTLRGERRAQPEGGLLRMERPQGRLERSFAIGVPIDAACVKATYRRGVLEITLPKAGEAKPRQVRLQVE
jgi:HSP20 family protein